MLATAHIVLTREQIIFYCHNKSTLNDFGSYFICCLQIKLKLQLPLCSFKMGNVTHSLHLPVVLQAMICALVAKAFISTAADFFRNNFMVELIHLPYLRIPEHFYKLSFYRPPFQSINQQIPSSHRLYFKTISSTSNCICRLTGDVKHTPNPNVAI